MKKECISCKQKKEVTYFYKHVAMKDGFLNKCKDCIKKYSKEQYSEKMQNPKFAEKEKERNRIKYHRLHKNWNKRLINYNNSHNNYAKKYPEKIKAKNLSNKIKVEKGYHKHHWSYLIEHAKDVIVLKKEDHYKAHRYIIYDPERMMYRRNDNFELLDTKEKHNDYIINKINYE